MSDAPDYDAIEARAEAATGTLSAHTTGVSGGDHWYIRDDSGVIAHIAANDGHDEELRQPRAELIVTAVNALPALIARCRELEAKVASIRELRDHYRTIDVLGYHADDLTAILDSRDPT